MIGKRNAALFYDRQFKLYADLKEYIMVTLGLPEDEKQRFLRILLCLDAMSAAMLAIPSWPYYFMKPLKPRTCDKEGLAIEMKFSYPTKVMWSFKACGLFTE